MHAPELCGGAGLSLLADLQDALSKHAQRPVRVLKSGLGDGNSK